MSAVLIWNTERKRRRSTEEFNIEMCLKSKTGECELNSGGSGCGLNSISNGSKCEVNSSGSGCELNLKVQDVD
jgi:hypothetical protein